MTEVHDIVLEGINREANEMQKHPCNNCGKASECKQGDYKEFEKARNELLKRRARHVFKDKEFPEPTISKPEEGLLMILAMMGAAVHTDGCVGCDPWAMCPHGHPTWHIVDLLADKLDPERGDV